MDESPPAARARRSWLKITLITVPAVAFVGLLAFALAEQGSVPRAGDPAPDFRGPRLSGTGDIALSDLRGKPAVINFWASWCLPCEDEAPILNSARRAYGDDVSFLGINIKDAKSEALAFEEQFDVAYPSVRDLNGTINDDYGLTGQPETFLIDADGVIVEHIPGAIPDEATLFAMLDVLVARL